MLDTNVLSELLRAAPEPAVLGWLAAQPADSLFVSAVTQVEMLLGARLLPAGRRRKQLEDALEAMFREDFAGHVLPFDGRCASSYADIVVARRERGRPVAQFDAQIAAISKTHRLQLATRNVADFDGCGLTIVNPWTLG
ncbi:MAG: type II toxin-antitoxin system VapC family toxin [Burkholderiales bacterium]|nr:type II toxin-antitoxin system VapC family toxin [Burkholderiales bacterium]